MRKVALILVAAIWLAASMGCGSEPEARKTEAEKQQALRDSTFGDLTSTLDRAEDVNQLQQDRKSQLDDAMSR